MCTKLIGVPTKVHTHYTCVQWSMHVHTCTCVHRVHAHSQAHTQRPHTDSTGKQKALPSSAVCPPPGLRAGGSLDPSTSEIKANPATSSPGAQGPESREQRRIQVRQQGTVCPTPRPLHLGSTGWGASGAWTQAGQGPGPSHCPHALAHSPDLPTQVKPRLAHFLGGLRCHPRSWTGGPCAPYPSYENVVMLIYRGDVWCVQACACGCAGVCVCV